METKCFRETIRISIKIILVIGVFKMTEFILNEQQLNYLTAKQAEIQKSIAEFRPSLLIESFLAHYMNYGRFLENRREEQIDCFRKRLNAPECGLNDASCLYRRKEAECAPSLRAPTDLGGLLSLTLDGLKKTGSNLVFRAPLSLIQTVADTGDTGLAGVIIRILQISLGGLITVAIVGSISRPNYFWIFLVPAGSVLFGSLSSLFLQALFWIASVLLGQALSLVNLAVVTGVGLIGQELARKAIEIVTEKPIDAAAERVADKLTR